MPVHWPCGDLGEAERSSPASRMHGRDWVIVARNGDGRGGPAELLDEDPDLDEAEARCRRASSGRPSAGQSSSTSVRHRSRAVAGRRRRRPARSEGGQAVARSRAGGVAQLQLVVGELELHRATSARRGPGSPGGSTVTIDSMASASAVKPSVYTL